jgi:hypothetical protein
MIEIWMEKHLVSDNICNIAKSIMSTNYTRNDKQGLHSVLVTLDGRFPISNEQDKRDLVTLNTI